MGDDFQDIDHVTARFSAAALEGSDLEIELSLELSENGEQQDPSRIKYNEFWCFYVAHVKSVDGALDVTAELGRTLYDKSSHMPHRYDEQGDEKVSSLLCRFLGYLSSNGARGVIVSDTSTLFNDLGTLEGKDLLQAMHLIIGSISFERTIQQDGVTYNVQTSEN